MKTVCRYCKHYRPDERYRGVIGFCDKSDNPTSVKDTCHAFEQGEQKWLSGESVQTEREGE